ncbi:MAG TPA: histidine kinase [Bryobacteraceae bacterium]|nr:histidine kinase [Bryobacteraceae bacterium]
MHPILESSRRLLLYLLAWAPIGVLLALVARGDGQVPWTDAAAALAPACLLYAFVCLSPWYICRALPLRLSSMNSVALTFAAAAAAASLLLAGSVRLAALAMGRTPPQLAPLFGTGVLLYLLSAGLHYAALAVAASRDAERREAEARTLAREAELQSLRIQLNPHFLFNSLHSISALATVDGARAREMCVRLADFLRASLGLGSRESIPLEEELALARSYLELEQIRFGRRLRVETEIEAACQECAVPALLLQPLVENAVKHGIANLLEGGSIRLAARRTGENVSITLENTLDPETLSRPSVGLVPGSRQAPSLGPPSLGLGQAHVRRRLEIRYGEDAVFDAGPRGEVYRVALRFPCEPSIASSSRA